jgi:hypothetical protein
MIKNIFILFAPGCGGNHLANILSMSKPYQLRSFEQSYNDDQLHGAHPDQLAGINVPHLKKYLDILINKSNVFCGHWSEYVSVKEHGLLEYFPNRIFCVIQIPKIGSKLYNRFLMHNTGMTPWLYHEVTLLYQHMTKLVDGKDTPLLYVCPDMLTDNSIKTIIDDLNNKGLDLDIDIDEAQKYHTKWINLNFKKNL